jgi:hypothetical protein
MEGSLGAGKVTGDRREGFQWPAGCRPAPGGLEGLAEIAWPGRQDKNVDDMLACPINEGRRRERIMKRFKSSRQVQRFLSTHDQVANVFPRRRDHDTAANLKSGRTQAFATWAHVTGS